MTAHRGFDGEITNVDFNKLIARVKNILLTPKTEWPVIAGETETVQSLYLNYILVLAAIPAIIGFIKTSIIGSGAFGITVRASIGAGITHMIIQYALTLVMLFVMALIIDALAGISRTAEAPETEAAVADMDNSCETAMRCNKSSKMRTNPRTRRDPDHAAATTARRFPLLRNRVI